MDGYRLFTSMVANVSGPSLLGNLSCCSMFMTCVELETRDGTVSQ